MYITVGKIWKGLSREVVNFINKYTPQEIKAEKLFTSRNFY